MAIGRCGSSEMDHRADALALMHEFKGLIDVFQAHRVGDEGVEGNQALLKLLNKTL
jgi:hypothetical protein